MNWHISGFWPQEENWDTGVQAIQELEAPETSQES